MSSGTGSECSGVDSLSGNNVAWHTSWSWSGGQYNVKSYPNINLPISVTQLGTISSIPTSWSWSYSGSNLVCDVAYDMFTASTASSSAAHDYELMVWLTGMGGAMPISTSGSPIASATIGGYSFNLYNGMNGAMNVYSFVATSQINSFSGDLMDFWNYLINNQGFSKSQYLQTIQAGTEPFT